MTVLEFANQVYSQVKNALTIDDVRILINNSLNRMTSEQIEEFIKQFLEGPELITDSQENSQTLKNLAYARQILAQNKGPKK